jgi:DNA-binding MarR family transcriptional regulator
VSPPSHPPRRARGADVARAAPLSGPRRRAPLEVVRDAPDLRAAFYDAMADDLAARVPGVRAEVMRAVFRLVTAYDAMHHFLAPRVAERGLSLAGFNLLCVLSQVPGGLGVGDLTLRLLVTRQNVNVIVSGLERKRLVRRVVDRSDRRVRRIAITKSGAALRDAILPEHLDRVGRIMKGFASDELRGLAALLDRIRAAVAAQPIAP